MSRGLTNAKFLRVPLKGTHRLSRQMREQYEWNDKDLLTLSGLW